jgi:hypothetical protein
MGADEEGDTGDSFSGATVMADAFFSGVCSKTTASIPRETPRRPEQRDPIAKAMEGSEMPAPIGSARRRRGKP